MGKSTRQIRRNKTKLAEKELSQKVEMFDKLPDTCISCEKQFDKKNKEMVQNWFVVIKEKQKLVNLYCPPCWEKAQDILKDLRSRLEKKVEKANTGVEKNNN